MNGKKKNAIRIQKISWHDYQGNIVTDETEQGMMEIIKVYMGKGNQEINCLKLLELFFDTRKWQLKKEILKREFNILLDHEIESEVNNMCNFAEGFIEMGEERGEKRGIIKGRLEGISEATIKHVCNLIEHFNLTVEEAMNILEVDYDKREEYKEKILN